MDDRPNRRGILPDADRAALAAAADPEPVIDHVTGLGATLIVTATRVIVLRQGAHFRPRHGVRPFPLESLRDVHLVPPRRGNGRIVLRTGPYPWQAVSVFVGADAWRDAERVLGEIRSRGARARRPPGRNGSSGQAAASDPPDD